MQLVHLAFGAAPPTRHDTSNTAVGLALWSTLLALTLPICKRFTELLLPASSNKPEIVTPPTSATIMAGVPYVGLRVAKPRPRTTVLVFRTTIGCERLYTPGVSIKCKPRWSAMLIVFALSFSA